MLISVTICTLIITTSAYLDCIFCLLCSYPTSNGTSQWSHNNFKFIRYKTKLTASWYKHTFNCVFIIDSSTHYSKQFKQLSTFV